MARVLRYLLLLVSGLLVGACRSAPHHQRSSSATDTQTTAHARVEIPDLSEYRVNFATYFRDGGTTMVEFENETGGKYYAGLECPVLWDRKPIVNKEGPLRVRVAQAWRSPATITVLPLGSEVERMFLVALEKWQGAHPDIVKRVSGKSSSSTDAELTASLIGGIVEKLRMRNRRR